VGIVKVSVLLLIIVTLFACEATIEPPETENIESEVTETTEVPETTTPEPESKPKPEMIVLVEPILEYDIRDSFSDGLLRVFKPNHGWPYGFIDKTGSLVFTCDEYSDTQPFREGLAKVSKYNPDKEMFSNDEGFINTLGNIVIPLEFNWILNSFYNGRACIFEYDGTFGLHGLIDTQGNITVPAIYSSMIINGDGTWTVCNDGLWGVIDGDGNFIIPLEYGYISTFYEDLAAVTNIEDGKSGFIDKNGNWVIPPIYDGVVSFRDGVAYVLNIIDGVYVCDMLSPLNV